MRERGRLNRFPPAADSTTLKSHEPLPTGHCISATRPSCGPSKEIDLRSRCTAVAAPASPDSLAGGHTKAGLVTDKRLKISYHGARTVTGGTPFGFNDRSDAHPFAVFKEVQNGGKIIVMGDGMVSLYMTRWEGVQDYQCQEFMQDVFRWLLK